MAPFKGLHVGPDRFKNPFPGVSHPVVTQLNVVWREFLTSTLISFQIDTGSNGYNFTSYHPNLVACHFGLSQILRQLRLWNFQHSNSNNFSLLLLNLTLGGINTKNNISMCPPFCNDYQKPSLDWTPNQLLRQAPQWILWISQEQLLATPKRHQFLLLKPIHTKRSLAVSLDSVQSSKKKKNHAPPSTQPANVPEETLPIPTEQARIEHPDLQSSSAEVPLDSHTPNSSIVAEVDANVTLKLQQLKTYLLEGDFLVVVGEETDLGRDALKLVGKLNHYELPDSIAKYFIEFKSFFSQLSRDLITRKNDDLQIKNKINEMARKWDFSKACEKKLTEFQAKKQQHFDKHKEIDDEIYHYQAQIDELKKKIKEANQRKLLSILEKTSPLRNKLLMRL
ncbi:unnamed protein product [Vicia faba]|uniref:Uncharacterized protein n=1 Tax=Vicia faba TaxID=3906 RepID=A0AAV0YKR8_VICFA|nr:unnamed protein product [Vicia faba]